MMSKIVCKVCHEEKESLTDIINENGVIIGTAQICKECAQEADVDTLLENYIWIEGKS